MPQKPQEYTFAPSHHKGMRIDRDFCKALLPWQYMPRSYLEYHKSYL